MTPHAGTSGGNTPLSPEEFADLIPGLATKEELNEWERENILIAREWAMADRTGVLDMVSDRYIRRLHEKMFDQTWKWAGQYRGGDKNLGVPFHQIGERLMVLFGDVRYWVVHGTYAADDIAVRLHHRLVLVHPFPNGNGRHARLLADVVAMKLGRPAFTWGSENLVKKGEARKAYLEAVRVADEGDIGPLLRFSRL
jgi:Fic-DOC domain mobile mystery protein B